MKKRMKVWLESQTRGFKTLDGTVEYEAVIFSSEFNRNKAFFDISKMKRWSDKLSKVLLNNSHDGKYFSVTTDKIKELRIETDENGITEAYAIIQSTNPEKVANPEAVTGFSIELLVDEKDVIANENGEYYKDYEWIGLAYLQGELAGSGDTRLLSVRTFAEALGESVDEHGEEQTPEQTPQEEVTKEVVIEDIVASEEFKMLVDQLVETKIETFKMYIEDKNLEDIQNQLKTAETNLKTHLYSLVESDIGDETDGNEHDHAKKSAKQNTQEVPSWYLKMKNN